jgi:hypothetical protein
LDERRQRALFRYYSAAGVGGLAIGVHTTQFAIRDPKIGLFRPLLELAGEELNQLDQKRESKLVRIAGICGKSPQACQEAELIRELGCHAGLLSLGAMGDEAESDLIAHCRAVARIVPLIGFYLQPAAGGRRLPYSFWQKFLEIENVAAIKIAPFNRYQTIGVLRAVAESGRDDVVLYTGNDDNIVPDLLTHFTFKEGAKPLRIVGGLLGHWAVWTKKAVELLATCHRVAEKAGSLASELLTLGIHVTDANAAFFDAANNYRGCIAGIHEVLRRQGLLEGIWCLDSEQTLSEGQKEEIDRVYAAYPGLNDDAFVQEHLSEWLK